VEQRQRSPYAFVEIAFDFKIRSFAPNSAAQDLFCGGLAHAARDAGNFLAPGKSHGGRQPVQRAKGVVDNEAAVRKDSANSRPRDSATTAANAPRSKAAAT